MRRTWGARRLLLTLAAATGALGLAACARLSVTPSSADGPDSRPGTTEKGIAEGASREGRVDGMVDACQDPPGPTAIYRSVGPGNVSPLATGGQNPLTITGRCVAELASPLPATAGVGDVLQYDSDGDGGVDALAFIHRRIDSRHVVLRTAAGKPPTSTTTTTTSWALLRAYTSLFQAEAGLENPGIQAAIRDFDSWTGGKDLVASDAIWNLACYGDAEDITRVTFEGWTADAARHLRIFTPVSPSQVGTSQRHRGVWSSSAYALVVATQNSALRIQVSSIRIEGLQIRNSHAESGTLESHQLQAEGDFRVSHCLLDGAKSSSATARFGILLWSGAGPVAASVRIWNNVIYDFGSLGDGIRLYSGAFSAFIHNNTVVRLGHAGIRLSEGPSGIPQGYARNNLMLGGGAAFSRDGAAVLVAASNNASDRSDTPGAAPIALSSSSPTDYFVSATDLHINATAPRAKEIIAAGVSLAADAMLPFEDDIDGAPRGALWDVGADQH